GLARARAEAFTPDLAGRVGRDYVGETCGGENEPQRAHVAGRHVVAAHGPAAQPDDDRHGLDTGRPGRARQARESALREAPHLSALSPEGRVAGRTLLAR